MKHLHSARTLAPGIALPSVLLLVAVAQAGGSSHSGTRRAFVALRKACALGERPAPHDGHPPG
jgi:hypothetical protein